jgi:hypothetical protein
MAYFEKFSNISYDPVGDKNYKIIKDILTRVKVREGLKGSLAVFEKYDIKDGETPEALAFKKYGSTNLHWVLLLFNEIIDPYYEWPLSVRDLEKYITNKYTIPNGTHHYKIAQSSGVNTKFLKVESSVVGSTAVTNYQYEEDLNDAKKQIRVLKPQYVLQFESELKKELGK